MRLYWATLSGHGNPHTIEVTKENSDKKNCHELQGSSTSQQCVGDLDIHAVVGFPVALVEESDGDERQVEDRHPQKLTTPAFRATNILMKNSSLIITGHAVFHLLLGVL